MTRHRRRGRTWPWSKRPAAQLAEDAVTEPMAVAELDTASPEPVEVVADLSEFARVLEAGVAATRARVEAAGCFYDATRNNVLTSPPPPMPGGVA